MRETSATYKRIFADDNHTVETVLIVGNYDLNEETAPEGSMFVDSELFSIKTHYALFDGDTPAVGCTVAGEIDTVLLVGEKTIPKMAKIVPWIRLVSGDGSETSEWLKKGEFFVDTREVTRNNDGLDVLTIHGYDAMLKAQADYPSDSGGSYPALDTYIAWKIAAAMGVSVDDRTWDLMTGEFEYGLEIAALSMQEILSSIAVPYAGNWIITEEGELRLVAITDIPLETNLLIDQVGYHIVFGTEDGTAAGDPVRILV